MTKEQAVNILDKAISQIQTTREAHQVLLQALKVLAENNQEQKE